MGSAPMLGFVLVIGFLFSQGNSQRCVLTSISIKQSNTGRKAGSLDTVFEVEVKNLCRCAVKDVYLSSGGFASSAPVDPKLFRLAGAGGYLLNDGREVPAMASVKFQYAWDHYFEMTPASLQDAC